jgi:hypothetical protein
MFINKEIVVTDHAVQRFAERTHVSCTGSFYSISGIEQRIIKSVKRSERIAGERIVGLLIKKGTTYAYDKLRNMLFPLESLNRGKKFRVITCLTKEEFEIFEV